MPVNNENQKHDSSRVAYSQRLHYAGAVLWASFLAACFATAFFFAMFDPAELGKITTWPIELDRRWGYTLGFFCFWLVTAFSSFITVILIAPGNKSRKASNEQQ